MREKSFLEAIVERPDNDGDRLVYADWLEENGRAGRADFIRAQVELASMEEGDPRYPALLARSRRCGVLTGEGEDWVDRVPGGQVLFRRGLVAGAQAPAGAWQRHGPDLWRYLPVEQLRLLRDRTNREINPAALVARRELARLRTLDLGEGALNVTEQHALLTDCPALASLRALAVGEAWSRSDGPTLRDTLRALALPSLDSLRLVEDSHAWREVPALRAPLRRLFISYYTEDPFEEEDEEVEHRRPRWAWLREGPHWPRLRHVALWFHINSTGGHSAEVPHEGDWTWLATSQVRDLTVSSHNIAELARAPDWGPLRALRISRDEVSGDISPLAGAGPRRLEALSMESWSLPDRRAAALYRSPALANLRHLGPWGMPKGQWKHFLAAPFLSRLHRLHLYLDPKAVAGLSGVAFPELRRLELGGVTDLNDLAPLWQSKNFPSLCTLVLSDVFKTNAGALRPLAQAAGLPHLSLVQTGRRSTQRWYVLGGGEAAPVAEGVLPLDEDFWEAPPFPVW